MDGNVLLDLHGNVCTVAVKFLAHRLAQGPIASRDGSRTLRGVSNAGHICIFSRKQLRVAFKVEVLQLQCSDEGGRCPCCAGRRLGLLEGASDSVHRLSSWTFQFATKRWDFSEGLAAMWGWAFFALLRVVPELSASFRSPR